MTGAPAGPEFSPLTLLREGARVELSFQPRLLAAGHPLADSEGMNVLVLISGVADPKWPLPPQPDGPLLQAHAARYALLSPFDEAALELALQLRDAQADTRISAVVSGPESLARKVAEWRLDQVQRLLPCDADPADARAFAAAVATTLAPLARDAQLVLTGREFGDWDDGSVPALVARNLRLPHFGLTLGLACIEGRLDVIRQRGALLERVHLDAPALLSVTNDVRNRLRHPLLKNVMVARKMPIGTLALVHAPATLQRTGLTPGAPPSRSAHCRMLSGTVEEQARALVELLRAEGLPA